MLFQKWIFSDDPNAVSIGGDVDTTAAIACSVAEAAWGVPESIYKQSLFFLDKQQLMIVKAFDKLTAVVGMERKQ